MIDFLIFEEMNLVILSSSNTFHFRKPDIVCDRITREGTGLERAQSSSGTLFFESGQQEHLIVSAEMFSRGSFTGIEVKNPTAHCSFP